jgi:dTDP-4-dehydrorhamnose 3,5-epimerase-like enzyme
MKNSIRELNVLGDERGQLVALESMVDIPFEVKRVFYIYGTQQGISRGNHAHYKANQFLIVVNGSCKVTLDDGVNQETFLLDKPNVGLCQAPFIWGTMHEFSSDCVLLVLADDIYKEEDYIRNYNTFLEVVKSDT